MADNLVKFVSCSALSYSSLAAKDDNTLYFVTDARKIYKGATPFGGGGYKEVTAFPATPEVNTVYMGPSGEVRYYDGQAWIVMVMPTVTALSGTGDDTHLATSKAIIDYVEDRISDLDAGALEGKINTNADNIATLTNEMAIVNGTEDGSIAKAASDALSNAKSYADGLASNYDAAGSAATAKAEAIAAAKTETESQVSAAKESLAGDIAKKADSATTLAGYGIADAYTKTQADEAIATAVANIDHLKRVIVDELPDVASADANTIYMVKRAGRTTTDDYDEYMLINGVFELVGNSSVDLTDYATITEMQSGDSTTLGSAKSYADDLASNYATSAQGTNADNAIAALTWTTF